MPGVTEVLVSSVRSDMKFEVHSCLLLSAIRGYGAHPFMHIVFQTLTLL